MCTFQAVPFDGDARQALPRLCLSSVNDRCNRFKVLSSALRVDLASRHSPARLSAHRMLGWFPGQDEQRTARTTRRHVATEQHDRWRGWCGYGACCVFVKSICTAAPFHHQLFVFPDLVSRFLQYTMRRLNTHMHTSWFLGAIC